MEDRVQEILGRIHQRAEVSLEADRKLVEQFDSVRARVEGGDYPDVRLSNDPLQVGQTEIRFLI